MIPLFSSIKWHFTLVLLLYLCYAPTNNKFSTSPGPFVLVEPYLELRGKSEMAIPLSSIPLYIIDPIDGKSLKIIGLINFKVDHYICFCYKKDKTWWHFDDFESSSKQVDIDFQVTPSVMVYAKVDE